MLAILSLAFGSFFEMKKAFCGPRFHGRSVRLISAIALFDAVNLLSALFRVALVVALHLLVVLAALRFAIGCVVGFGHPLLL